MKNFHFSSQNISNNKQKSVPLHKINLKPETKPYFLLWKNRKMDF